MKTHSDIALEQNDIGTKFVTMVIVMMTIMATLSVGGALVVQSLRASWVGAITGHMTIEIPVMDNTQTLRGADILTKLAKDMRDDVASDTSVKSVRIIGRAEVQKLVSPWLGDSAQSDDLPLPALLALEFKNPKDEEASARITALVAKRDAASSVETHQAWLSDLKRFSFVLFMAALSMACITIFCSILTVAGAVRARLEAHYADIDLLHLMGATDTYIGTQFVRVVVKNVGMATLTGTVAGLVLLKTGSLIAGELQAAMLPALHWGFGALAWFCAVPMAIVALCWTAAHITVLRTLRVMP